MYSIVTCTPISISGNVTYAGPCRETITTGPSQPRSECAEIETPIRRREEKTWRGCPLTIRLEVWGSVVSSPSGVRAEPQPKMDFMHIWGQKEAIWNTLFSIFERWRGPKRRGARENSPIDRPALMTLKTSWLQTAPLAPVIIQVIREAINQWWEKVAN